MKSKLGKIGFLILTLASMVLIQGCDDDSSASVGNAWMPADVQAVLSFTGTGGIYGGGSASAAP
ncbi:MAG TPA: hypothetical protein VLT36_12205 [Candidatus Dormibacteraeota bacterium]|nr:hypothetical protein [Candidatus Dormibacteraeota bacterium]